MFDNLKKFNFREQNTKSELFLLEEKNDSDLALRLPGHSTEIPGNFVLLRRDTWT